MKLSKKYNIALLKALYEEGDTAETLEEKVLEKIQPIKERIIERSFT
tara:strand:+ start:1862 stop:2002 length:141 start_codon:yes stop_codon:yes gene_type:complete